MSRIAICLLFWSCTAAFGQNITAIEYFIDTDPGFGNGTSVPVTPAPAINNLAFPVSLTSIGNGIHTLFVRTKDANNIWSLTTSQPFLKLNATASDPLPNMNKVEYFIDADPGYGAGIDVPVTPAISIADQNVVVSLSSVTVGNHIITFRARDVNGNWSVISRQAFILCNHPATTANAASSITSSSFLASWTDVPGSISYQLDVSTDNFATFVSGYNSKVITAPALNSSVTGLAQATTYQYRVRAVASCTSVQSNTINISTLATAPSSQPTNLLFSSITTNSYTAFFTPPGSPPTGYLVIRKIGSSPTFVPATNVSYTVGQVVGDGTVVSLNSATILNETGLSQFTNYHYDIFSYNQVGAFISYLTTSPLSNSVTTAASEPVAQPTTLTFNSITSSSFNASFAAAAGPPTGYIVLRKAGSTPTAVPVDGVIYTTTVGADVVAFQGSGTAFSESGLTQNTEYFYAIYAFNGAGALINYLPTLPLQGSQLTLLATPSSPTALVFGNVTPSAITVSYTASGSPSGYLVVRKVGVSPAFAPQPNTIYTTGQVLSDGIAAYVGASTTFNDLGLTASTNYFYDVFAYNQAGALIVYQSTAPLEGNRSTFTAEPTAQASSLTFTLITTMTLRLTFAAASPAPTGYLVLRAPSAAPTSQPVDGNTYVATNTIGDGTVAYVGAATMFDDSGLLPGTSYHYQAFSYNGAGSVTNYLGSVTASNSGSAITIPPKPGIASATAILQNQFTANWNTTTGAASYRLDVSTDNFVTRIPGYDNLTVAPTTSPVIGLLAGTTYQYRARAVNAGGTSVNSDPISVLTVPSTPVFTASTLVGQTTFQLNWSSVTNVSNYFIDISTDAGFVSILPSYNNLSLLSSATSLLVTGLTAGNTYHSRIRSANTSGTSPSSVATTQLMIPQTPVLEDAVNVAEQSFKAKWLPANGAVEYRVDVTTAADDFTPSLPSYTDVAVTGNVELLVTGLSGLTVYKYRVRGVNSSGPSPSSTPKSVSTTSPPGGQITRAIPFPTGGTVADYRIVSIPRLADLAVSTLLDDASYEKNWRVMHYVNDATGNIDVRDVKQMNVGLGYWINSNINPAPTIQVTGTDTPINETITLQPGWNQIGNPFTFGISWPDVVALNPTLTGIETLYTFNVPTVSATSPFQISDGLLALGGGYVNSTSTLSVQLNIPATISHFNGRIATPDYLIQSSDLSQDEWFVPLQLQVGDVWNNLGGFGMHPAADASIDRWDAISLPHFFTFTDIHTSHQEFFQPSFMRDVVPSGNVYSWTFTTSSTSEEKLAVITWNNQAFGTNAAQLFLYDSKNEMLVDMKRLNAYRFELNGKHELKFLYGRDGNLSPDVTTALRPFPNPFSSIVTIPFITSNEDSNIEIVVFDLTGRPVRTLLSGPVSAGYHEATWNGGEDTGARAAPGIYLYRFSGSKSTKSGKIILK